ncbi:MAG: ABC-F family ATP-binding cassette domain-containing protein [Bacteroidales bacterium]|nr:ABC-F family ATP-binding cassette domain-containing protein [Bacteroidales bacterium]
MASYLQIENISKSYGPKVLFKGIGFNVNEGDKVALIAPNGTGKTSLLRILAGKDSSDSGGKVLFLKDIRIAFLEQDYDFNPEKTILDQIMDSSTQWTGQLDQEHFWEYERRVQQLLTQFGLSPETRMKDLSGGEIKRVAITQMLASEADFYIMDEPTNHLDTDAIEFLENRLKHSRCTLFMVTHDRYFLDRVCNTVMEMDRGNIYIYRGDYTNFLEKRQERIDNYNAETEKVRNVFRRELEWIHASPCARTGKAKYRKQAFEAIKERAADAYTIKKVDLSETKAKGPTYLGNKVIDCKNVSFWWEGKCYLKDFSYNFQRYERIGIVGRNAAGKTTFLNLITGGWNPSMGGRMEGVIQPGDSLKVGYYHQSGMQFKPGQTVLETVNDTHLLGRFLFTHDMLNNPVERLSGGEKRRLYLLTVLMQQPNFLILDEPTNDLDIVTLDILEEYLLEYKGSLVIVSHDRHFLDRLVDHLFVFCGDGMVKDFIGNYTEYRSFIKDYEAERKRSDSFGHKGPQNDKSVKGRQNESSSVILSEANESKKRKLSWKEQQELKALEVKLADLEAEKEELEAKLSGGTLGLQELQEASARYASLKDELDVAEMRWLELSEI